MRGKILKQNQSGKRSINKIICCVTAISLVLSTAMCQHIVQAVGCPNVRAVFARGSGETRWTGENYLAFKEAIETKLKTTTLSYDFIDLDYPAIGVNDLSVLVGAYIGAGEAYEFGDSVNVGLKNLREMINSTSCPGTKYVLGGYSQGGMLVINNLKNVSPDKIIYVATFGDPKYICRKEKDYFPLPVEEKTYPIIECMCQIVRHIREY